MSIKGHFGAILIGELRMKCIYCDLERKFNREHVFSAGLGGDDDDYVLRDAVCEVCNSAFSKLETELLQKSPTALARIGMQPAGRDRGNKTKEPTYTTEATYIVDEEGRMLEANIMAGFKAVLFPQIHIAGKNVYLTAADGESLKEFLSNLRDLVEKDEFGLIKKIKGDVETSYEVLTVRKTEGGYKIGQGARMAKPPKGELWLQTTAAEKEVSNRLYRSKSGELTYKTAREDSVIEMLLAVEAYFEQLGVPSAWEESTLNQPIVQVESSINMAMVDRAIAKIGVNFLAYLEGAEYVRHPGFADVKSYILMGEPQLPWTHTEDQSVVQLLGCPPAHHHALLLSSVPLGNGMAKVFMALKLYGTAVHKVCLAETAPHPGWSEPKYYLINYVSRKVQPVGMVDYMASYCDLAQVLGPLNE